MYIQCNHALPFHTLTMFLPMLYTCIIICLVGADGIIISPSTDYTTFENNPSTFAFSCSGNGTYLSWTVDGQAVTTSYVLNKGISYIPYVSPDVLTVSSQLIVPTTKANINITVICVLLDASFNYYYYQSSDPVRLILQGTVQNFMCLSIP